MSTTLDTRYPRTKTTSARTTTQKKTDVNQQIQTIKATYEECDVMVLIDAFTTPQQGTGIRRLFIRLIKPIPPNPPNTSSPTKASPQPPFPNPNPCHPSTHLPHPPNSSSKYNSLPTCPNHPHSMVIGGKIDTYVIIFSILYHSYKLQARRL